MCGCFANGKQRQFGHSCQCQAVYHREADNIHLPQSPQRGRPLLPNYKDKYATLIQTFSHFIDLIWKMDWQGFSWPVLACCFITARDGSIRPWIGSCGIGMEFSWVQCPLYPPPCRDRTLKESNVAAGLLHECKDGYFTRKKPVVTFMLCKKKKKWNLWSSGIGTITQMKSRVKCGTSDNDLCHYMDVCCWDDGLPSVTLHMHAGEVLLSRILFCYLSGSTQTFSCPLHGWQPVKCNRYEWQLETLTDARDGTLIRPH